MKEVNNICVKLILLLISVVLAKECPAEYHADVCQNLEALFESQEIIYISGTKGFHNLDLAIYIDQQTPAFVAAIDSIISDISSNSNDFNVRIMQARHEELDYERNELNSLLNVCSARWQIFVKDLELASLYKFQDWCVGDWWEDRIKHFNYLRDSYIAYKKSIDDIKFTNPPRADNQRAKRINFSICGSLLTAIAIPQQKKRSESISKARSDLLVQYRKYLTRIIRITDVRGCEEDAKRATDHYMMSIGSDLERTNAIWFGRYQRCIELNTSSQFH